MPHEYSPHDTLAAAVLSQNFPRHARLLLAVSGGPDSVALLDTVSRLCAEMAWSLRIGHINHMLRGDESHADEEFVRGLGRQYLVPVLVRRTDVARLARDIGTSVEDAGRRARYEALYEWLRTWPGDFILTGHTRDDQMETVLLNLVRGTGIRGLGGMVPRRGALARPLLDVGRLDVMAAIRERALNFRSDPSNEELRYRRNAIRHHVVPPLTVINPAIGRTIARTAALIRDDAHYLEREAADVLDVLGRRGPDGAVAILVGPWRTLAPAMRRHVLRAALTSLGVVDLTAEHLKRIHESGLRGGEVIGRLPFNLHACVRDGCLILARGPTTRSLLGASKLPVPGCAVWGQWRFEAGVLSPTSSQVADLLTVCASCQALLELGDSVPQLEVRSVRPGDRVYPPGVSGSSKLQDVFVNRKIPRNVRHRVPVVSRGSDIIWVPGIVRDRRFTPGGEPRRLIHVIVKRLDGVRATM